MANFNRFTPTFCTLNQFAQLKKRDFSVGSIILLKSSSDIVEPKQMVTPFCQGNVLPGRAEKSWKYVKKKTSTKQGVTGVPPLITLMLVKSRWFLLLFKIQKKIHRCWPRMVAYFDSLVGRAETANISACATIFHPELHPALYV